MAKNIFLSSDAEGDIAVVVGTRPEIIKLAPIVRELGERARVVYTGQHYDEAMAGAFFDAFHMPRPDRVVSVGGRTRGDQIAVAIGALAQGWAQSRPAAVIVQGDTNTALAGGLAANTVETPLVHVEAGLRSFDRAMPEEHNRRVIDHLADLCLAPTGVNERQLRAEQVEADVEVTGNTVVEAVESLMPSLMERRNLTMRHGVSPDGFVLATIHRPENTDNAAKLAEILDQLARIEMPVVIPLHPRTRARIVSLGLVDKLHRLQAVEPMGYTEFLGLAAESAFLVSDSGGVQEEASVYKRPVIVVRNSTERPEVLGTFTTLVQPDGILSTAQRWLADLDRVHSWLATLPSPYGSGDAARLSAKAIQGLLD